MKFVLDFKPDELLIAMEGDFTYADFRTFRQMMAVIRDDESRQNILLDLSNLTSMDHTGLRFMMMAHDVAKSLHRDLLFVDPRGTVRAVLLEAARYNNIHIAA